MKNETIRFSFVCILVAIGLGGCVSKPKLIITPLKTTEVKLSKILKEFEMSGFELIVNRKYDVHRYTHSVIVHSPGHKSYSLAIKIQKKLIDLHLVENIKLIEYSHQNHSFTKNSIGIFIVEEDGIYLVGDNKKNYAPAETVASLENKQADYLLGHMYTSYDCDFENDITFRFWDDSSFEMEIRDLGAGSGDVKFYDGHWIYNIQSEELYINYDLGKALSFTPAIKRFYSNDGWVMRRALEFKYSTNEVLTGKCDVFLVEEGLNNSLAFD